MNKYGLERRKSGFKINHNAWNCGLSCSKETKMKISKSLIGKNKREKCHFWRGGITLENKLIRSGIEFKEWRKKVFERDNYICQICNKRSKKEIQVILHPHHIKSFAKYPEERFNVENGITLCIDCHKYIHKIDIFSQ